MKNRGRLIFLLSLAIKLTFAVMIIWRFGFDAHFTDNDSGQYLTAGINIFQHGAFSTSLSSPFLPTMFRMPIYSIFLAINFFLFGKFWILSVYILQGLLMSLAALFLYHNLKNTISEKSAFWCAILFAVEPFSNFITNVVTPDSLFAVTIIISMVSFWNFLKRPARSNLVVSSVFLALATLIKPISQFLPLLFLVVLVVAFVRSHMSRNQILKSAVLYLGVFLLVLSPWLLRNKITFNNWNISSLPSYNLYFYNAATVIAAENKIGTGRAQQLLLEKAQKDTGAKDRGDLFDPKYSGYLQSSAFKIILSHKLEYFKLHILTLGPFFINDGYGKIYPLFGLKLHNDQSITLLLSRGDFSDVKNYIFNRKNIDLILFGIGKLLWLVIYAFIIRRLYKLWKEKNQPRLLNFAFFSLIILYFALLTGPVAAASYRMPVQAFIFTLLFI